MDVIENASDAAFDIVFFSAGGAISLQWAPRFTAQGALVIDNSRAFRMKLEITFGCPASEPHCAQLAAK